jgi:DNA-binding transcriptional ArsR family regulator
MQVTVAESLSTSVEAIGPSLVMDLSWCIRKCQERDTTDKHVKRLFGDLGEYGARLTGFWDDDMMGFSEAEVLAYLAGAIECTEFDDFRDRCERALRSGSVDPDLDLMSETDEDAATIAHRLRRLIDSADFQERYFSLLSEVWSVVASWWETQAIPSLRSAVVDVQRKLLSGSPWYDVNPRCSSFEEKLPGIIERSEEGKPVRLAACAFFGEGLYYEFPDLILFGFGIEPAADSAKSRVASAILPLRALADPTRLAIFEYLKMGPTSIKDIAASFSLSQPTISVHVKRLREVGLVDAKRLGTQQVIDVNWAEADKLSGALRNVLSH